MTTPSAARERERPTVDRRSAFFAAGLTVALIVVAVARLATYGWASIAPDDARYLFVGLSTFAGNGPLTPSGNVFLLRSPAYGLLLAAGGLLLADPIFGARVVAASLTVAGLVGAVRLGWLAGGRLAAVGTAVAILAMPLIWRLLPSLRVDLPQTAGVIAVLLAIHRPTIRRWALAGALLGLTILVKETILLLGALPIAALGFVPRSALVRLWTVYLGAAALVAGWWWIVVWAQAGVVFPANAIGTIEGRDVGADIRIDMYGAAALIAVVVAWVVVAWRARQSYASRLLVVAATCLLPPAAYATLNGLSSRNYAGLAVLSAVAAGAAAAALVEAGRSRWATPGPSREVVRVVAAVLVVIAVVAVPVMGQRRVGDPVEPLIPARIAAWLRDEAQSSSRAVMTFRYSEITALELFGRIAVPGLPATRVAPESGLDLYVWLGLRDRQLFGYRRQQWVDTLGATGTGQLVLAGPHALTPSELVPALGAGLVPGLTEAAAFTDGDEWARIYAVDPAVVRASPLVLETRLSPAAAVAWLDLGSADGPDQAERITEFVAAGPVIVGRDVEAIIARLGGLACAVPAESPADGAKIIAADAAAADQGAMCAPR